MSNAQVNIREVTTLVAEVVINGESKGQRAINGGPSLKDFATSLAREYGITTFTVNVDGKPLSATAASQPVQNGQQVAVNAKDSRGGDPEAEPEGAEAQADGDPATDDVEGESSESSDEGDEAQQ